MTKRKPVDENSKGVSRLKAIIAAQPGIKSEQIAATACYTLAHTKNVLSVLSKAGIAKPVPIGIDRGWFLAEIAAPLLEQWDRTRRRRGVAADKPPTKRDRIQAMSKEPGGVSMAQIMAALDLGLNPGGRHCLMMVHQGRIFRSQRQGARLRWFDTPEKAREWAAKPPVDPSEWVGPGLLAWENPGRPRRKAKAEQSDRVEARMAAAAQRHADKAAEKREADKAQRRKVMVRNVTAIKPIPGVAPTVSIPKPAPVVSVDYSGAKLTICPSPKFNYRHEYVPGSDAHTGFVRDWQQKRAAA